MAMTSVSGERSRRARRDNRSRYPIGRRDDGRMPLYAVWRWEHPYTLGRLLDPKSWKISADPTHPRNRPAGRPESDLPRRADFDKLQACARGPVVIERLRSDDRSHVLAVVLSVSFVLHFARLANPTRHPAAGKGATAAQKDAYNNNCVEVPARSHVMPRADPAR